MNDIKLMRKIEPTKIRPNTLYARLILSNDIITTESSSTAGYYRTNSSNCIALATPTETTPSTARGVRFYTPAGKNYHIRLYDTYDDNRLLLDRDFIAGTVAEDTSNTVSSLEDAIVIILNEENHTDTDNVAVCYMDNFAARLPLILDMEITSNDNIYISSCRVPYNTNNGGKNGGTVGSYGENSIIYDILYQFGDITIGDRIIYKYNGLKSIYTGPKDTGE